ncbi:Hypothetical protein, putative [Bodo saltans]|uniref:Uncharacterized protein n=1 Tax=Bodo saltans TaxID=75058 RepID=A0A0S4KIS6_BODSA|nr:Hypothetical protein, putative [Bodo saltans]|eukprot:CUI15597.1 Hypothetical protein, putative [Bodo saltans]
MLNYVQISKFMKMHCTTSTVVIALVVCVWQLRALTISDLALNAESCATLRNTPGATIPCECRLNTGKLQDPVPCYPNCCPKTDTFEGDWCDNENRLQWSVYDQLQCVEAPAAMYVDDSVNCFDQGTIPYITSVVAHAGVTQLAFELSRRLTCNDLYIAPCKTGRVNLQDFRINTTDKPPRQCWLTCAPDEIEACTSYSCWAHRGQTASTVKSWTVQRQLPAGDYALVCKTLVSANAVTHVLYQYAAASAYFRVN